MWQTLRAELAYMRAYLVGALVLASAVTALVSTIFAMFEGPPPDTAAGIRGIYLAMAFPIVGFIAQGLRHEERRGRMLFSGPATPRQIIRAFVALPILFLGLGLLGSGALVVIEALVTGTLHREALTLPLYVGGMVAMGNMMSLLAQEATAAHRQRRRGASVAGWGVFAGAVLLFAAATAFAALVQGPHSWPILHLANVAVALVAMLATVRLYPRRTDFTR